MCNPQFAQAGLMVLVASSMYKWFQIVGFGGVLLASIGCGGRQKVEFEFIEVEGLVKINGQPADNVLVKLIPDASADPACPPSIGTTDSHGMFTLATHEGVSGAVEGKYLVTLADLSEETSRGTQESEEEHQLDAPVKKAPRIPPRYLTLGPSTPLIVVKEGGEPIVIDVSK